VEITCALDAAQALVTSLSIRYGEVVVQVTDGKVTIVRQGHVLKPGDLERMIA